MTPLPYLSMLSCSIKSMPQSKSLPFSGTARCESLCGESCRVYSHTLACEGGFISPFTTRTGTSSPYILFLTLSHKRRNNFLHVHLNLKSNEKSEQCTIPIVWRLKHTIHGRILFQFELTIHSELGTIKLSTYHQILSVDKIKLSSAASHNLYVVHKQGFLRYPRHILHRY